MIKAILSLGVLAIGFVIVLLIGLQGPNILATMNDSLPNTNPDIKTPINAISDAKDKVDSAENILSTFWKLFEFKR